MSTNTPSKPSLKRKSPPSPETSPGPPDPAEPKKFNIDPAIQPEPPAPSSSSSSSSSSAPLLGMCPPQSDSVLMPPPPPPSSPSRMPARFGTGRVTPEHLETALHVLRNKRPSLQPSTSSHGLDIGIITRPNARATVQQNAAAHLRRARDQLVMDIRTQGLNRSITPVDDYPVDDELTMETPNPDDYRVDDNRTTETPNPADDSADDLTTEAPTSPRGSLSPPPTLKPSLPLLKIRTERPEGEKWLGIGDFGFDLDFAKSGKGKGDMKCSQEGQDDTGTEGASKDREEAAGNKWAADRMEDEARLEREARSEMWGKARDAEKGKTKEKGEAEMARARDQTERMKKQWKIWANTNKLEGEARKEEQEKIASAGEAEKREGKEEIASARKVENERVKERMRQEVKGRGKGENTAEKTGGDGDGKDEETSTKTGEGKGKGKEKEV
ncbi:MAG: hypothetical protein Q9221_003904 [Calogaya cf. arnoldii]